jgi:hemerythrin
VSIFIWSEALYRTGVAEVDAQHRRLFALANGFYDAFKELRGQRELAGLFTELLAYAASHFALEESLMTEHAYPKLAEHRALHVELTGILKDKAARFDAGEGSLSGEVLEFLSNWLDQHITVVDRELGDFLRPRLAGR